MNKTLARIFALLVASVAGLPAFATNYVVNNGISESATKTLIAGDTLTVQEGGTIQILDLDEQGYSTAVSFQGNTTITNYGVITNHNALSESALSGSGANAGPVNIINTGTMSTELTAFGSAPQPAVDLASLTASPINFTSIGGTITGGILLPNANVAAIVNLRGNMASEWQIGRNSGAAGSQGIVNIFGNIKTTTFRRLQNNNDIPVLYNLEAINILANDTQFSITGGPGISVTGVNHFNVAANTTVSLGTLATGVSFAVTNLANSGTMIFNGVAGNQTTIYANPFANTGGLVIGPHVTMAGVLNLNAGSNVTGDIVAGVGGLQINVNGNFATAGTIVADQIAINNSGTLAVNNALTAPVTNAGILALSDAQTITGTYMQTPNGIFQTTLNKVGIGNFGSLTIAGAATLQGKIEVLSPKNEVDILSGNYTIISSGGILTDNTVLVAPSSLVLSITKTANANNLILTAIRTPYVQMLKEPPTAPYYNVANTLEQFRNSGETADVRKLLLAVDSLPTVAALQNALVELAPTTNGGSLMGGLIAQNLALEKIADRLDADRAGVDLYKSGYSAGDMAEGRGSYGPMVFANTSRQQKQGGIQGYTAFTGGFGFLGDVPLTETVKIGAAISYADTHVKSNNLMNVAHNTTFINSLQGAFYSSLDYSPFFIDSMVSVTGNRYKNKRQITATQQTATGNFNGFQYTGKARGGFVLLRVNGIEAAPLASIQYTQLKQNSYIEKGASGANLAINAQSSNLTQLGLGLRISDTTDADEFYPEIHAMVLNDLKSPNFQTAARFTEGGPSFITPGVQGAKRAVNMGASLTMLMAEDFLVTGGYDLESKKAFTSHSASLKFRWTF